MDPLSLQKLNQAHSDSQTNTHDNDGSPPGELPTISSRSWHKTPGGSIKTHHDPMYSVHNTRGPKSCGKKSQRKRLDFTQPDPELNERVSRLLQTRLKYSPPSSGSQAQFAFGDVKVKTPAYSLPANSKSSRIGRRFKSLKVAGLNGGANAHRQPSSKKGTLTNALFNLKL